MISPSPSAARGALLASLLLGLTGCGGLTGKGYLFTRDSQPLQLSDEAQLRQGHIELEFDPDPMWSADLRLHNERSDFSVSVPSSAYQGRSFFLASRESGLRYDIQARWRESKEDKVERDSSESCAAPGFCSKTVRRLKCAGKTYRSGTDRYEKHLGDEGCQEVLVTENGNFPDCPGTRSVRNRYQIYRLLVSLEFTEPTNKRQPLAEFDGESQRKERLLETVAQGACRTY
ncbi:hypothetical protein TUM18999_60610 [Pseudomonas tohonis]|uniref:Uncharacterized protein n=1 Tax=Pseudomonas tohonis TaxID=2725477 RepID=A0A6J4EE06_9PSED|nr:MULTISPECIES: hypothetical protein [Pseudomonas]BBP86275.1 hypothetical protein PHLH8_59170 [Pseudomonas sp. Pc102]BCG27870.1 hypothetical protein TUM18999_60610 [Pseudomonas tohonis]GJN52473.1 hypothetical protein TUM20286_22250 [Pseudomonas tohonis]